MKINLETASFLLSLMCLFYIVTAKRKQFRLANGFKNAFMDQHFVFLMMLISTVVSSITSLGGIYFQHHSAEKLLPLQFLCHGLYFLSHNMLPIGFALYIMHVNGSSANRKPIFFAVFAFPFVLSELMVLTNTFTHFIYYVDEDFLYHRGTLILLNYAFGLFYFFLGFVFFFKHKKAISSTDRKTIGTLLLLTAAGILIQAMQPWFAVELFTESVTMAGLLLMFEERSGHVDPITGALNRIALIDDSRRMIENKQTFRVVLVKLTDINLFSKLFNGRDMDNLLLEVSEWLTSISSEQTLYNYRSGDFAIIINGKADYRSDKLADAILERFSHEWKNGEASIRLEVAVSVLCIPEDVSSLDEFTEVLTSGYRKTGIGSRRVPYDELFANRLNRKIEEALREAVDSDGLRVWYQPIWSFEDKRTIAAEALLRIDSEALRGITPDVYIPIAEQCGIIRDIGLFVFEDVCRFLKTYDYVKLGISYIELNLSVHQFIYDDLVECFERIRKKYGIPVEAINLEITESASISETPIVGQTMQKLRSLGYTFSLDDFGTGYSTLMQFIRTSYKNVKMDKSLLWESEHNEMSARLLDSLIKVIRSLGCNVVQEGVETKAQLERTKNSGGNLIQGYYFSKPIPENEFIAYLQNEAKTSAHNI